LVVHILSTKKTELVVNMFLSKIEFIGDGFSINNGLIIGFWSGVGVLGFGKRSLRFACIGGGGEAIIFFCPGLRSK